MEIISRILEAVNGGGGATRTRIMYHAFVSHAQMKEYLSNLEDNGMLHYDSESEKFKITEKGRRLLKHYNAIENRKLVLGEAHKEMLYFVCNA